MGGESGPGTRCGDRRQHRRIVRGAGAVRVLRPGHGVRARRTAGHAKQPHRRPAGPPRSPADGPRRAGIRRAVPRSARRHGGRRGSDLGEPAGLHLLRRGRPVLGTGHTLRDEFTAYVPSRPQLEWQIRRRVCEIANVEIQHRSVSPTAVRLRRPAGDRGAAGQRHRRARIRRRRPGRRRGRSRHQAAGVAGAVGISAPAREDRRRGHWLCVTPVSAPRGAIRERVVVAGASRSSRSGWAYWATRTAGGC